MNVGFQATRNFPDQIYIPTIDLATCQLLYDICLNFVHAILLSIG